MAAIISYAKVFSCAVAASHMRGKKKTRLLMALLAPTKNLGLVRNSPDRLTASQNEIIGPGSQRTGAARHPLKQALIRSAVLRYFGPETKEAVCAHASRREEGSSVPGRFKSAEPNSRLPHVLPQLHRPPSVPLKRKRRYCKSGEAGVSARAPLLMPFKTPSLCLAGRLKERRPSSSRQTAVSDRES